MMQPITASQISELIQLTSDKVSSGEFQERLAEPEVLLQFLKTGKLDVTSELTDPENFAQFLQLENPIQAIFEQLSDKLPWRELLNQIEQSCFLEKLSIEQARPSIAELWKDEVAENPYKPPAGWRYAPVPEAVERFQNIFGSDIKAKSVFSRAEQLESWKHGEGIMVSPSLSFHLNFFEVPKVLGISAQVRPWEDTEDGRAAYAKIAECLLSEKEGGILKEAYTKAHRARKFSYRNWREGELTSKHILLTPACRKSWQKLESDDDFIVASANSGSLYGGYSVRHARIKNVLIVPRFGQDCVLVAGTLAIQPERLTEFEHLGINCPGNQYSVGGGGFANSVCLYWNDCELHFDDDWTDSADCDFGSAVGRLG